jgi:hypothetical protein
MFCVFIVVLSSLLDGLDLAFRDKIYSDWLVFAVLKNELATGWTAEGSEFKSW